MVCNVFDVVDVVDAADGGSVKYLVKANSSLIKFIIHASEYIPKLTKKRQ